MEYNLIPKTTFRLDHYETLKKLKLWDDIEMNQDSGFDDPETCTLIFINVPHDKLAEAHEAILAVF